MDVGDDRGRVVGGPDPSSTSGPARIFETVARITVTAVSDEGDNVIVWGRPEHAAGDSEPIGFVFQTKGAQADVGLAERASRLTRGTEAAIDYTSVADDWNIARGLSAP